MSESKPLLSWPIKILFLIIIFVVLAAIGISLGEDNQNDGRPSDDDINQAAANLCENYLTQTYTPITGDVYTANEGVVYRMEPIWDNGLDEYYMVMGTVGINIFTDRYYHCTFGLLDGKWTLGKLSLSDTGYISWVPFYENEDVMVRIGAAFPDDSPTYPPYTPDLPVIPEPDDPGTDSDEPDEPETPEWNPEPLLESARDSFLQNSYISSAEVTYVIRSDSIEVTFSSSEPVPQGRQDFVLLDYKNMQNIFENALSGAPENTDLVFLIDIEYYDDTPEWIPNGYESDIISLKALWTGEESYLKVNGIQYTMYGLPSGHMDNGVVYNTECEGHTIRVKYVSNGSWAELYVNYNDLKNAGFV